MQISMVGCEKAPLSHSNENQLSELSSTQQTDHLVLYSGWEQTNMDQMFSSALRLYQQQNPTVEVEVVSFATDSYADRLTIDLMAGKGPDLVWFTNAELPDPYKSIEGNVFEDLTPFINTDTEWDRNLYNAMLDAGLCKGGRYFIPADYITYTSIVNEKALDAIGLSFPNPVAYEDFVEQITGYVQSLGDGEGQRLFFPYSVEAGLFFLSTGMQFVEYKNGTVICDKQHLQLVTDLWKTLYPYRYDSLVDGPWIYTSGDYAESLLKQQTAVGIVDSIFTVLVELRSSHRYAEEVLQVCAMPNFLGEKAVARPWLSLAIRKGSPNQQNAYSFLKVMLSDVVQREAICIPVLKSTVQKQLDLFLERKEINEQERDNLFSLFTDVEPYPNFSIRLWLNYIEYFTPYWENEATFESCYEEFYNMLNIYINE